MFGNKFEYKNINLKNDLNKHQTCFHSDLKESYTVKFDFFLIDPT